MNNLRQAIKEILFECFCLSGKCEDCKPQEDYDGPDNCEECNEDWIADIITDAYEEHFVDDWIGIAAAKIRKELKKLI